MKTRIYIIAALLILSISHLHAQSPLILKEWASYSGISDSAFKNPVLTDGDYSYVATVSLDSLTGPDMKIIKYNENGDVVWRTMWSGTGYGRDQASGMAMDTDYLYICGASFSSASNFDFVTMKLKKSDGNIQWLHTYNGAASNYDLATAIVVHDSSVYVTGVSFNTATMADYHTIKYHKDGTFQWGVDFDYNNLLDIPFALSYSDYDDSTLIIAGGSQSTLYDWDYQTIIYDYTGNLLHQNRVSGSTAGFDRAQAVTMDVNGNIYLTGGTYENGTTYDIKNVKLDKTGNLEWLNHYDSGGDDIGNDIIVDASGNPYICGSVKGNGQDYFAAKLNRQDGSIIWSYTIDGDGRDDSARAMRFDSRGNIVITGQAVNPNTSSYDFLTIAYSPDGTEIWRDYFDGPYHGDDNATDITADNNGNIYVTGQVTTEEGMQTVTIKYRTDYFMEPPAVDTPSIAYLFYPNEGQIIDGNDSIVSDSVHYYTLHHNPQLYFGYGEMNLVWSKGLETDSSMTDTINRVDVSFLNSSNQTEAFPLDEDTSSYLNFFYPHCTNGIINIHGNKSLVYTDVWSNIDVVYSSNSAGLKMTFICSPGSNPQEIGLHFEGQDGLSIEQNWYLEIQTLLGTYMFEKPRVYQLDTNNNHIPITWQLSWGIQDSDAYFLGWDSYDTGLPLVIEIGPQAITNSPCLNNLCWSTYFGGKGDDAFTNIKTSDAGEYFVVGNAASHVFPLVNGLYFTNKGGSDAIVLKMKLYGSNHNNVIWGTYIGGSNREDARGLVINSNNEPYIGGYTASKDFVTSQSTNLNSYNQPVMNKSLTYSAYDAFIVRFKSDGLLLWSTYFGGRAFDIGWDLGIEKNSEDVYFIGDSWSDSAYADPLTIQPSTYSNSYNQTHTSNGSFIARFDKFDNLKWSTYFDADDADVRLHSIDINNGAVYIAGFITNNTSPGLTSVVTGQPFIYSYLQHFPYVRPNSTVFQSPAYNGGSSDAVILEFNYSDQLIYSTLFGGDQKDEGFDSQWNRISTTGPGDFILVGSTESSTSASFPLHSSGGNEYYQSWFGGGEMDGFITRFTGYNNAFTTYFGGDSIDLCLGIVQDQSNYYVTGRTGSDHSNPGTCCSCPTPPMNSGLFPTCTLDPDNYVQPYGGGGSDGFIAKFNNLNELQWCTYIGGEGDTLLDFELLRAVALFHSNPNDQVITVGKSSMQPCTSCTKYPQVDDITCYYQNGVINNVMLPSTEDAVISRFRMPFTTKISEIVEKSNTIEIYPNPTSNYINIKTKDKYRNQFDLDIIDISGKVVYHKTVDKNFELGINISNLTNGIYAIRVNGSRSSLFIKQ